jgi:predicted nuclease of predicted toxin-antitoxin system
MTSLLFDQNLSPRLVHRVADLFPGSIHVQAVGLATVLDRIVWDYARANDYIIVTKDADLGELGTLLGFPPKVIWIRRGNCTTLEIEHLIRDNQIAIELLANEPESGVLTLF